MHTLIPIITDVDDVVLDWIASFRLYMQSILKRPICAKGPSSWDMSEWLDIPHPLVHVRAFNASEHFGRLISIESSCAFLIRAHMLGHPIFAVTACSDLESVHDMRKINLDSAVGPIFEDILFVPLGGDKRAHLQVIKDHHGPGLWIEDNPKNALAGARVGHHSIVLRRSHNRSLEPTLQHEPITWIDSCEELEPFLGQARLAA